MRNAGITIKVQVDPIVKEWIVAKNNNFPVIKFAQGDILHKMIHEWLQKANRKSRRKLQPDQYITIYIPTCNYKNVYKSHHLSVSRENMVNDYLYQAFKKEFYKHMIDKIEEGYTQTDALYDYMDFICIKEGKINFQMLKKSWDRSEEKRFYYNNVNNIKHTLLYITPVLLDISGLFDNISNIFCPALINT
jgi:hypothetical protein